MAKVKCIRACFCGGLPLAAGNEYEVSADDAVRLVGMGRAEMIDASALSPVKERKKAKPKKKGKA